MFKHVLSALVVSSVMVSGAAFAADQVTSSPQAQTATTKTEKVGATGKAEQISATTKTVMEKKHQKVAHKQEQVKASVVKSDTAKAVEATPAKSN